MLNNKRENTMIQENLIDNNFEDRMIQSIDMNNVINQLTPREIVVLKMRFMNYTLKMIGQSEEFKIASRLMKDIVKTDTVDAERIRQIEARAMRKLRHPSRSNALKHLLIND
jgi:RNA polymerase primary sigma factor